MSLREDAWALITNAAGTAGTSFVLTTGHGARFPATTVGYYARAYTYADPGVNERVYVSARSTDTLTVVRNVDGRGAQNIAASGWALEVVHDIAAIDSAGFHLNLSNDAGPFVVWVPSSNPAKLLQANDALRHKALFMFTNGLGGAHTFTLSLGFGLAGTAQQVYHAFSISVPANTVYRIEVETLLEVASTSAQTIISKVVVYNLMTTTHVTTILELANGAFDTNANDWHFLHTGTVDTASASCLYQGYNLITEYVRARGG